MNAKLNYLFRCAVRAFGSDHSCPVCQSPRPKLIIRKYGVTALRECQRCQLRYRTPKDRPEKTKKFYEDEVYKQGFTTDLPSDAELEKMLATHFAGTEKSFVHRIKALEMAGLKPGAKILDFGCSWGYGSWQMRQAGYTVFSYEIGRARADYAEKKLGCTMVRDLKELAGTLDCFFSAHVIEHLPNPTQLFNDAEIVLKPGGMIVCYCPNGAREREHATPAEYHKNWGLVHPVLITPGFFKWETSSRGYKDCSVRSGPWEWDDSVGEKVSGPFEGSELLAIIQR